LVKEIYFFFEPIAIPSKSRLKAIKISFGRCSAISRKKCGIESGFFSAWEYLNLHSQIWMLKIDLCFQSFMFLSKRLKKTLRGHNL